MIERPLPERVLVTGITGSGGSFLADFIAEQFPEVELFGLSRWHASTNRGNLSGSGGKATLIESDLLDLPSIVYALRQARPEWLLHLASFANPRAAFDTPTAVMANNILGTIHLFEAIRLVGEPYPLIQLCSSSEVYGQVTEADLPVTEETRLRPISPYGASKAAQDLIGQMYGVAYKIPVIRTRAFTYLNPRRADLFATNFARQIARIEVGLQETLLHGNLDSVRTIFDVRDCVRAYWLCMQYGAIGEVYNIAGNTMMSVGDVLGILRGMARCTIPCQVDPALLRPSDVTLQTTSTAKFVAACGFQPLIPVTQSLRWLLEYWREKARLEAREKE